MKHGSLVGQRFGRLIATADAPPKVYSSGARTTWRSVCRCDCGNLVTVPNSALKDGNTKSCGCLQIERQNLSVTKHGHTSRFRSPTRTWRIWNGMKRRCANPSARGYENYGGRGIKVCCRWQEFKNFLEDMGECPRNLTIERIDSNGHYEPGNCRWATAKEQARNKRTNRIVTYRGVTACVKDVCKAFGIPYERVNSRLKRKWPVELAFSVPDVQGSKAYRQAT